MAKDICIHYGGYVTYNIYMQILHRAYVAYTQLHDGVNTTYISGFVGMPYIYIMGNMPHYAEDVSNVLVYQYC